MPGKEIKGRSKRAMYKDGSLKPIPEGNKGLPLLDKEVRKQMGFLKEGGMVKDKRSPFMGGGVAYAGGGRAMKRKGGKV